MRGNSCCWARTRCCRTGWRKPKTRTGRFGRILIERSASGQMRRLRASGVRGPMLESATSLHPRPTCSTSSREVRTRWRLKLALRGAVARRRASRSALFLLAAYGMEWARFSAASIIASRVAAGRGARRLGLLVPRPAAAPPRHRRAGRAVSRRARAVAAGDAAQRGRSEPARARPANRPRSCGASSSRRSSVRAHRRGAPRRAAAAAPLRASRSAASLRSRCWPSCARSGVPPQRAVGDAARLGGASRRRRRTASR